jgi:hypothetical protein
MKVEVNERDLDLILRGLRELRNNKAARGQWRLPAELDRLMERLKPRTQADNGPGERRDASPSV